MVRSRFRPPRDDGHALHDFSTSPPSIQQRLALFQAGSLVLPGGAVSAGRRTFETLISQVEEHMTKLLKTIAASGLAITAALAVSEPLLATQLEKAVGENQAFVTELGADTTAVSYWTSAPDGWHVVTTVDTVAGKDTDAERHAIVRFSATLDAGQSQLISVPAALGQESAVLRIRRLGDQIEMERVADSSF
jgi:hypothetical protein